MMPDADAAIVKQDVRLHLYYESNDICPPWGRGHGQMGGEILFGLRDAERDAIRVAAARGVYWPYPHFDFLPLPSGGYEEYILVREKMTVSKSVWNGGDTFDWHRIGTVVTGWNGPFVVVASGDKRFVVNSKGELHLLPKSMTVGANVKQIWADDPIQVLAYDAKSRRTFAFTKSFFFEVRDPVTPSKHTIDIVRGTTSAEHLELGLSCSRVVKQYQIAAEPNADPKRLDSAVPK